MNYSDFRFILDIQNTIRPQVSIPVTKNETQRRLLIELTDGGKQYFIEDGCVANFEGLKPDGERLLNSCVIANNKTIVYEFTPQTTSAEGIVYCELCLYSPDGTVISPKFIITVDERVIAHDGVVSDSEKTAIDNIMIAESARAVAERERNSAEAQRNTAEIGRISSEQARDGSEKARSDAEILRDEAEVNRGIAERQRTDAENARDTSENARIEAEKQRASAEAERAEEEQARSGEETLRRIAESARVVAEQERELAFDEYVKELDEDIEQINAGLSKIDAKSEQCSEDAQSANEAAGRSKKAADSAYNNAANAQRYAEEAETSNANAQKAAADADAIETHVRMASESASVNATASASSMNAAREYASNAIYSAAQAAQSATEAKTSETNAKASEEAAKTHAEEAKNISDTFDAQVGDYVKKTDIATSDVPGLVGVGTGDLGVVLASGNRLGILAASKEQIKEKTHARRPIVPSMLDCAVKEGVTNNSLALTDEEKSAAQGWLGVDRYAREVINTVSGENISIRDGIESPVEGCTITGVTVQDIVENKNLFDKSKAELGFVQSDGTVQNVTYIYHSDYIDILGMTSIKYIDCQASSSNLRFVAFYDDNYTFISGEIQKGEETRACEIAVPTGARYVRLNIAEGRRDIAMVTNGTCTDYTYEEYKGGATSPNPLDPITPKCLKQGTKIKLSGKNLLLYPNASTTYNGVTINVNEQEQTITLHGTYAAATNNIVASKSVNIPIKSNTKYILSVVPVSGTMQNNGGIDAVLYIGKRDQISDSDGNWLNAHLSGNAKPGALSSSVDGIYCGTVWIYFRSEVENGFTFDNYTVKYQLEEGNTITEYEPCYNGGEIVTPCDLYEGDIYYPVSGKVERHCAMTVLDEKRTWVDNYNYELKNGFVYTNIAGKKNGLTNFKIQECRVETSLGDAVTYKELIANGRADDNAIAFYGISGLGITNKDDWLTFVANHPLTVFYELETPVTEQYDPQPLSIIEGTNNIIQAAVEANGTFEIRYRADTKLYIDNKFAELQALILEA